MELMAQRRITTIDINKMKYVGAITQPSTALTLHFRVADPDAVRSNCMSMAIAMADGMTPGFALREAQPAEEAKGQVENFMKADRSHDGTGLSQALSFRCEWAEWMWMCKFMKLL